MNDSFIITEDELNAPSLSLGQLYALQCLDIYEGTINSFADKGCISTDDRDEYIRELNDSRDKIREGEYKH